MKRDNDYYHADLSLPEFTIPNGRLTKKILMEQIAALMKRYSCNIPAIIRKASYSNIESLHLDDRGIKSIDHDLFDEISNLKFLEISNNPIREIYIPSTLQILVIGDTDIQSIKDIMSSIPGQKLRLKELYYDGYVKSSLISLATLRKHLPNLNTLGIEGQVVKDFQLSHIAHLHHVYLHNTNVQIDLFDFDSMLHCNIVSSGSNNSWQKGNVLANNPSPTQAHYILTKDHLSIYADVGNLSVYAAYNVLIRTIHSGNITLNAIKIFFTFLEDIYDQFDKVRPNKGLLTNLTMMIEYIKRGKKGNTKRSIDTSLSHLHTLIPNMINQYGAIFKLLEFAYDNGGQIHKELLDQIIKVRPDAFSELLPIALSNNNMQLQSYNHHNIKKAISGMPQTKKILDNTIKNVKSVKKQYQRILKNSKIILKKEFVPYKSYLAMYDGKQNAIVSNVLSQIGSNIEEVRGVMVHELTHAICYAIVRKRIDKVIEEMKQELELIGEYNLFRRRKLESDIAYFTKNKMTFLDDVCLRIYTSMSNKRNLFESTVDQDLEFLSSTLNPESRRYKSYEILPYAIEAATTKPLKYTFKESMNSDPTVIRLIAKIQENPAKYQSSVSRIASYVTKLKTLIETYDLQNQYPMNKLEKAISFYTELSNGFWTYMPVLCCSSQQPTVMFTLPCKLQQEIDIWQNQISTNEVFINNNRTSTAELIDNKKMDINMISAFATTVKRISDTILPEKRSGSGFMINDFLSKKTKTDSVQRLYRG